MKRCSFCAEEIQDAATICRFCNRDVPRPHLPSPARATTSNRPPMTFAKKLLWGMGAFFAFTVLIVAMADSASPTTTISDSSSSGSVTAPVSAPSPPPPPAAQQQEANSDVAGAPAAPCDLDPEPVSAEPDLELLALLGDGKPSKPSRPLSLARRKQIAIEGALDECINGLVVNTIGEQRTYMAAFGNPGHALVTWSIADSITKGWIADGAKVDVYKILKAVAQSPLEYRRLNLTGVFPVADEYGRTFNRQVVVLEYAKATVDKINFDGIGVENIYRAADKVMLAPDFD